jgi:hypothetical protein
MTREQSLALSDTPTNRRQSLSSRGRPDVSPNTSLRLIAAVFGTAGETYVLCVMWWYVMTLVLISALNLPPCLAPQDDVVNFQIGLGMQRSNICIYIYILRFACAIFFKFNIYIFMIDIMFGTGEKYK